MRMVNLEQRSDEWRAWRNKGITATDSVVILGKNPTKTPVQLWREKKNFSQPEDLSKIPAVRFGVENEDRVREAWNSQNLQDSEPVCAEAAIPLFRASFDGLCSDGTVLEIKCPLPDGKTLEDVRQNGEQSKAYQMYYVQVQHQLMVAESNEAHLVFLDGDHLIEFVIQRDEAVIQEIIDRGRAFWACVENGNEPESDREKDVFIPEQGVTLDQWLRAAECYSNAQAKIDELKTLLEPWTVMQSEAKKVLQSLMGEHKRADFGGVAVTHSVSKGKVNLSKVAQKIGFELTPELEDQCRDKEVHRWSFKVTGSEMPKGINDPKLEERIERAEDVKSAVWF